MFPARPRGWGQGALAAPPPGWGRGWRQALPRRLAVRQARGALAAPPPGWGRGWRQALLLRLAVRQARGALAARPRGWEQGTLAAPGPPPGQGQAGPQKSPWPGTQVLPRCMVAAAPARMAWQGFRRGTCWGGPHCRTCERVCTHIHTQAYPGKPQSFMRCAHTHSCPCTPRCSHTSTCAPMCTPRRAHTHTHTHTYTHTCMPMYTKALTHAHMRAHVHQGAHTRTHTRP